MEESPTSQQSQRSRPNYRHPILLEDDRSYIIEATLSSPSSINGGSTPSDYDPEAPYPHTDTYARYPNVNTDPESGTPRIGRRPSPPTATHLPWKSNPTQQRQRHSLASNASNGSQQSGPINIRGSLHKYHQGVIFFLGAPPFVQVSG
jgi:hypothetical protein